MSECEVSILMLTHGAFKYTHKTLSTLQKTKDVSYETVIVDNLSGNFLRHFLLRWQTRGWSDKLCFLNYNSLFAEGNNIASRLADQKSKYYLLLNSDVEIRDPLWLRKLIDKHERGITSYGLVKDNPITRVDGYCLLIDSDLYRKYQLNGDFQWWWSVTKLQAEVLVDGFAVKGYEEHEEQVHHFGGKSGQDFRKAKGLQTDPKEIVSWFEGKSVQAFSSIDD